MQIYETLAGAERFAALRSKAAMAHGRDEEGRLWHYLTESSNFVQQAGQVYRFEDYLEGLPSRGPSQASPALNADKGAFTRPAAELLRQVIGGVRKPQQKQHVRVLIALLDFIADTGQVEEVEDFFNHQHRYAPLAIARFASREEAEEWLKSVEEPPSPSLILIGDDYHHVWYLRDENTRRLYRDYVIESAIAALTAKGLPQEAPSFATRAEAEEWLKSHPAYPKTFVVIAGEPHLAVNHQKLKCHTLHQVAAALSKWEERQRAIALEEAMQAEPRAAEKAQ